MADFAFVALTILFFAITAGYVAALDRLDRH